MTPEARAAYIVGCIRTAADIHVTEAEKLLAEHDTHRRTQVLAEAKFETVAWLVKKAREQPTWKAGVLASKVDRGAVRAFIGTAHYRDAMDAHRAEVLTEAAAVADRFTERWPDMDAMKADGIIGPFTAFGRLADELRDMAGKDTGDGTQPPAGEPTQPATDFFQPGRTYTRGSGRWSFHCLAVAPTPWMDETRAVGYLTRNDGTGSASSLDPDDWAHGAWAETTEGEVPRG